MITLEEYLKNIKLELRTDEVYCPCSKKHVPDPQYVMGLDNGGGSLYLCPTAMINLASLLKEYQTAGGKPPGSVTKHYGRFVRKVAATIYNGGTNMSA
jgi:hypothetical protein